MLPRHVAYAAATDLAHDSNRPQIHLLPAANWMNDPNGPIFWKGRYHMYFQYNPHAAIWGDMHWAHASSPDMVHWQHMPIALSPTPGGPDQDGCFSGSAVNFNGVPTFLYTGIKSSSAEDATLRDSQHNFRETQCLATSSDPELKVWDKLPQPVLPASPPGMSVVGFRDPCLWKEADVWYMGIGSGVAKKGGCVLLYRSQDLRHWEYLHPLIDGNWNGASGSDPADSGEMWECPDFFSLGEKHVLLYSTMRRVYWMSGEYDAKEHLFHPQQKGELDYGPRAYYAPKSMVDEHGNRILWGWIPETRPEQEYSQAGWAGLMSLPRVLSLNADGHLEMQIVSQARDLRVGEPMRWVTGKQSVSWLMKGLCAELFLRMQAAKEMVHLTIGTADKPAITYQLDPAKGTLTVNNQPIGLELPRGEMRLSLFLDGSVIEAFVNDRLAHTSRIYNLDPEQTTLDLRDPASSIQEATLWQMRPISPDRLTS